MSENKLAIVGIGCRFPGKAHSVQEFWNLIKNGTDAIIDVPKDRWDTRRFFSKNKNRKGKSHSYQSGFLQTDVRSFDPLFFGISPLEAATLDPQQRLLLQTTWEAFEDAGIPESKFRGSNTGVFIGGFTLDNKLIQLGDKNRNLIRSQTATSSTMVMLSNRISYSLDLKGPSLSIDTACSSSLVAIHYACQSVWSGESSMAVAGGVNLMLMPDYPIAMSKGQFLSDHSRCKAFDADAKGYVRGEGAGVILIKPLDQALADNDIIHAVVHNTGSNQDGKTEGITVPNSDSQKELLNKVIKNTDFNPNDICYLEAHGTGTPTGDPIEFDALNATIKENTTKEDKVAVGSVKTNIGHLEAAAGVAGFIKASLVLKKNKTVPHLHFNNPNPKIDFENAKIRVITEVEKLSELDQRFALVNSFGYGGTNANVLLSNSVIDQQKIASGTKVSSQFILPLSAKSESSLRMTAEKMKGHLSEDNYADTVYSLLNRRTQFQHRAVCVASSFEELQWQLEEFSQGNSVNGVEYHQVENTLSPKLFVYSGMGPQWFAMGRELYKNNELFQQKWNEYDQVFEKIAGWSMLDELMKEEESSQIKETQFAQPANFFLQAALTELWKSYGIVPEAVLGHSVGEVSAAYISGALDLKDALTVSYHRSRIQQKAKGQGSMIAVGLSELEIQPFIDGQEQLSIAAVNGPNSITLAGELEALNSLSVKLTEANVFNKLLEVDIAYHSYQMDPLKEELLSSLKGIEPKATVIPIYSTVTATCLEGASFDHMYWWNNVRKQVKFAAAVTQAINDGYSTLVEIGPHPVLRHSINDCVDKINKKVNLLFTIRRKENEQQLFLHNLAHIYALGNDINWSKFFRNGNYIKLPFYAWDNKPYSAESKWSIEDRVGLEGHPFLNQTYVSDIPTFQMEVNDQFLPYLNDHVVSGAVVLPGAAYVEAAIAIHEKVTKEQKCTLKDVEFSNMLVYQENDVHYLQTSYNMGSNQCEISSYNSEKDTWLKHASAKTLEFISNDDKNLSEQLNSYKNRSSQTDVYDKLDAIGLQYGPSFRGIKEIKIKNSTEFLVTIEPHHSVVHDQSYFLHPSVLDACFQSVIAVLDGSKVAPGAFVPTKIDFLHFAQKPDLANQIHCLVKIKEIAYDHLISDMTLVDLDGQCIAELQGLKCQAIESGVANEQRDLNDLFYEFNWKEQEVSEIEPSFEGENILFYGPSSEKKKPLIQGLEYYGAQVDAIDEFSERDFQDKSYDRFVYAPLFDTEFELSYEKVKELTFPILSIFQSLKSNNDIQLVVLTKKAHYVLLTDKMNINYGALVGLNHVIGNEHPHISPLSIDVDEENLSKPKLILKELSSQSTDEDIALRGEKRFVRSLMKPKEEKEIFNQKVLAKDDAFKFISKKDQGLKGLVPIEAEIIKPKSDEITLEVKSTSINLKDILKINGQLSEFALQNTYCKDSIGMEVCGTVIDKGDDVKEMNIGDDILMTVPDGGFKKILTTKPEYYIPKVKSLSYDQMNIGVPFMTAWHALVDKADLSEGETVLIHNGTGGVGLAAIQIAQRLNATIITTAGSDEKKAYLKKLGVAHVLHSRNLNYVKEVMEITDGKGVDVVLNAISGESLIQSFELLANYGRFIEIGKKDISLNTGLPMKTFNKNVSFFHIDLDQMFLQKPQRMKKLLQTFHHKFEHENYEPMPVTVFKAQNITEAFEFMNESKHIGKVTLNFEDSEVSINTPYSGIDKEGSFLITGGTGGFGFEIAKWLIAKEVKRVVLCSRSGLKDKEKKSFVELVNAKGVTEVVVQSLDITNAHEVAALIQKMMESEIPFKGIFHGAMILDDAFMKDLDEDRFLRVMNPKVLGAINLHKALGDYHLDFFLCFSSISALIGNVGQGNYVAANVFLDNFSHWRNAQGLTCTSLNLGVLSEVGVVSRNEHVGKMMDGAGIKGFDTDTALRMLDYILYENPTQISFFDVDWEVWGILNPRSAGSSRFKEIVDQFSGKNALSPELQSLLEELYEKDKKQALSIILEKTKDAFGQVMKISPEALETDKGINLMGVDSLISVEVGRAIKAALGVDLSTMDLLNGPSLLQLSEIIYEKIEHHFKIELSE